MRIKPHSLLNMETQSLEVEPHAQAGNGAGSPRCGTELPGLWSSAGSPKES